MARSFQGPVDLKVNKAITPMCGLSSLYHAGKICPFLSPKSLAWPRLLGLNSKAGKGDGIFHGMSPNGWRYACIIMMMALRPAFKVFHHIRSREERPHDYE